MYACCLPMLVVLCLSVLLHGMEPHDRRVVNLPCEIKAKIIAFAKGRESAESEFITCSIAAVDQKLATLLIPYASPVRIIDPKTVTLSKFVRNWQSDREYKFDTQLWIAKAPGSRKVRLIQHTGSNNDQFTYRSADANNNNAQFLFDGINVHRRVLFSCTLPSTSEAEARYEIFTCTKSFANTGPWDYKEALIPACMGNGYVHSIMLHPKYEKFMCSVERKDPVAGDLYTLSMVSVDSRNKAWHTATISSKTLIKKTVSLGKNTYFGLDDEGTLVMIWQEKDQLKYAMQKHQTKFKDIAVDDGRPEKHDFHSYISCLSNEGDVFVCHLLSFEKPTLFWITKVPKPEHVFRFLYNNGFCQVLYKDGVRWDTKMLLFPDDIHKRIALHCYSLFGQEFFGEER